MGGSAGGPFDFDAVKQALAREQRVREDAAIGAFQSRLSEILSGLLARFNDRDSRLALGRLQSIKSALSSELEGNFEYLFGGSVAKHTYVDGLSDIDCLVEINDSALADAAPSKALERIGQVLGEAVRDAEISVGQMAVTLKYTDGMELQLLPVVKDATGRVHVASFEQDAWSSINPIAFMSALTRRNAECGGKLVPTIKLAKAALSNLPEANQLTGYHLESLAIEAFRGYDGTKTPATMLPTFFERARSLVLTPIVDSTGQSVHVDADLGPANSAERQELSFALGRLARQMRIASATASETQWQHFFEPTE